jgi:hypothetical protein
MIVDPNEKLPGSTSVACWLVLLVNVSVLSFTSGVVAGGKLEPGFLDPELEVELDPQLKMQLKPKRRARAHQAERKLCFTLN